jgi:hypothetical protein
MGFGLKQGRLFSRAFPGDTSNRLVVNEATLRTFQIPENKAIGQRLNFDWQGQSTSFEIVGVVKIFTSKTCTNVLNPMPSCSTTAPVSTTSSCTSIPPTWQTYWDIWNRNGKRYVPTSRLSTRF